MPFFIFLYLVSIIYHEKTAIKLCEHAQLVLSMCFMAFIFNADYLAVNLAIPSLASEFHDSLETIQWVLSGYILIWSILVIPAGKLLETYSTRRTAISGVALFMLASVFAGMSQHTATIILSRMLQGAGAAIFLPACYTMMFNHFSENERGKVMGYISLAVGVGLALGPVLGGALIEWYRWPAIFFINIPIALLVITVIYFFDNQHTPNSSAANIMSKSSFILLAFILPSFLFVLSQFNDWTTNHLLYCSLIVAVVCASLIFINLQKKIKNPLIPPNLFKNPHILACYLGIFIVEFGFSTVVVVFGLYLQNQAHFSSLESSLIFLAMTVTFGLISVYGGRLTDKKGILKPVMLGLIILGCGCLLFPLLEQQGHLNWLYPLLMLMGLGTGLAFTALNAGIVKVTDAEQVGISSSIFAMITLIGNAMGIAVSTIIYLSHGIDASLYLSGTLCLLTAMIYSKLMRAKQNNQELKGTLA